MNDKTYTFDGVLIPTPDIDGAYIECPFDVRYEFRKRNVKIHATFDGEPFDCKIIYMGFRLSTETDYYVIGVNRIMRAKIGKQPGDTVHVTLRERT